MSETNNSSVEATNTESTESTQSEQTQKENAVQSEQQQVISPKLTKKLKLKVDGNEVDEELPFEIDENNKQQVEFLKRHLQMSKAASKRMQEASLSKKQAEHFIEMLQNDPLKILNNDKIMGQKKFREIAEQFLTNEIQKEMMSPEEIKRLEMEDKLRKYEEQEKKIKEQEENERIQKLQDQYAQHYQKVIIDALNSSSLPKNPFTVKRMAQLMEKNLQHGLELEPQHLAQLVREDYQKELVSLVGASNPEQILALFGEDLTNKIRKHDLEKLKGSNKPQTVKTIHESIKNEKPMSREEWRELINKRANQ